MSPTRSMRSVGWTPSFNAGIYIDPERVATPEGHARTLAVNVFAPYVLTAESERPARRIYISSGMHRGGDVSLHDIGRTELAGRAVDGPNLGVHDIPVKAGLLNPPCCHARDGSRGRAAVAKFFDMTEA
jgi:hypothetical protein